MTDAEKQIREALAAGPTPGPWSVETVPTSCGVCHKVGPFPGRRPGDPPRHACLYADYPSQCNPVDDELEANAAFIAACNPAAIRELLAEMDRLRGLLCQCDMRTRLVGDGCEFCNPQLAAELAKERR